MHLKSQQKGVTHILLLVLIILSLAGVGYWYFTTQQSKPESTQTPQLQTPTPTPSTVKIPPEWKTYQDTDLDFEFRCPPEYVVTKESGCITLSAELSHLTIKPPNASENCLQSFKGYSSFDPTFTLFGKEYEFTGQIKNVIPRPTRGHIGPWYIKTYAHLRGIPQENYVIEFGDSYDQRDQKLSEQSSEEYDTFSTIFKSFKLSQNSKISEIPWRTYTNQYYKFKISYPPNYTLKTYESGGAAEYVLSGPNSYSYISIFPKGGFDRDDNPCPDDNKKQQTVVSIGNKNAVKKSWIDYVSKLAITTYYFTDSTIPTSWIKCEDSLKNCSGIEIRVSLSTDSEEEDTLQQILSTFEFLE